MTDIGRPSAYTQEIADLICERLAGGESLRSICDDEGMPTRQTVFNWLQSKNDFFDQYTRARKLQADSLADDVLEISDDGRNDWMDRKDPDNKGYDYNGEAVARSRLRVDARKWLAGKLRPKKYGDSTRHEMAGDPDNPVVTRIETVVVDAGQNPSD